MFQAFLLGGILTGFVLAGCNGPELQSQALNKKDDLMNATDGITTDTATFGTGCFWCTEAVFQELNGVLKVTSGYSGGHVINPTYDDVCTKNTGHAEVVQIVY